MQAIEQCRTEALGGHVYNCQDCDETLYSYHSCKNRHCPKCQNGTAEQWLERQRDLLFWASAAALQKLADDPRFVGGPIGMFEAVGVTDTSFACVYPDTGNFTAQGRIKDKDEGFTDYTVLVTVITPAEATQDLITFVESPNLQQGIDNSLDSKLETAIKALEDLNENNDGAAINTLQAFINTVEAQRGKSLTDAQADELIGAAQSIIDSISS